MSIEMVRCTSCRGTKKLAKLGGVVGDCNICDGTGKIKASDKPKMSQSGVVDCNENFNANNSGIIGHVANVVASEDVVVVVPEVVLDEPKTTEIVRKRAVFKRKKEA